MLTPEEVISYTGHAIGGVCPFALADNSVKVYCDLSLKRFSTIFPACGSGNSAIELTCDELLKFPIAANGLMSAKIGINIMQIFYNFIAIFIRVAANSLSNVFQKKLAFEGENPINVNFINYLLLSLFSIPLLFLLILPALI